MDIHALEVQEGAGGARRVPVDQFPFSIGRGVENDLVLSNASVSRHHAVIERSRETICIVDNRSRNGVYVNGDRIEERRDLKEGDVIHIGGAQLRVLAAVPTVPLAAEDTGTLQFFPSPPVTDLIENLSTTLSGVPPERRRRQQVANWEELLRLLMEAPLPQMFETLLDTIRQRTSYDRCLILFFADGSPERLRVLARKVPRAVVSDASSPGSEVLVSRGVLRRVAASGEVVMVTRRDEDFSPTDSFILSGAGAALCFPLAARNTVMGVLYLDRRLGTEEFSLKDVETLAPLVGLIALKVENFQLLEAYLDAEIHKRDLDTAERVQRDFLPGALPGLPGYAVDGCARPCRQVGGDFFDLIREGEGQLTMVMGDVSGKGLPSALYMVGVLSALRAHTADGIELQALMARLERYVRANFHADHFLTLFVGKLDASNGSLRYCNAGHVFPLVVSAEGKALELEGSDPALNVIPWERFHCFEHHLAPGDLLLIYTDGLIEAQRAEGELFGRERLVSCLLENRDKDLPLIRERLFAMLEDFSGASGLEDDKSMILLKRLG